MLFTVSRSSWVKGLQVSDMARGFSIWSTGAWPLLHKYTTSPTPRPICPSPLACLAINSIRLESNSWFKYLRSTYEKILPATRAFLDLRPITWLLDMLKSKARLTQSEVTLHMPRCLSILLRIIQAQVNILECLVKKEAATCSTLIQDINQTDLLSYPGLGRDSITKICEDLEKFQDLGCIHRLQTKSFTNEDLQCSAKIDDSKLRSQ